MSAPSHSDTMTNPIQNSISTSAPVQSVPADDCTESISSHENKATESNKSATEDKQLMKSLLTQIRNMPEANLASPSDDFSSNWHHSAAYPPLGQHNLGHHQALPGFANNYISKPSFASLNNIHPSSLHQQLLHAKSIGWSSTFCAERETAWTD